MNEINSNLNTKSAKRIRIEPFQPVFDLKRFALVGPAEFSGLKYCNFEIKIRRLLQKY
jgi:hypothetical protein